MQKKLTQKSKIYAKKLTPKSKIYAKKLAANDKIYAKKLTQNGKIYAKNSAAKRRREAFVRFIILCYFTILPRFRRCFSGVLLRRFAP